MPERQRKRRSDYRDRTGERYGDWLVLGPAESSGRRLVRCLLCQTETTRLIRSLVSGASLRCHACATPVDHGCTGTPEHNIWANARRKKRIPQDWSFRDFLLELGARPESDSNGQWVLDVKDPSLPLGPGNATWGRRGDLIRRLGLHGNRGGHVETRCQAKLLKHLRDTPGPVSTPQLRAYVAGERRAILRRIKLLEDKRLVRRVSGPRPNGRMLYWQITQAGRQVLAKLEREKGWR